MPEIEETSGYVRPERVNKWPNSMTVYDDDDDDELNYLRNSIISAACFLTH